MSSTVINVPPVQNSTRNDDGYPPVVERSIGVAPSTVSATAYANTPGAYNSAPAQPTSGQLPISQQTTRATQTVNAGQLPSSSQITQPPSSVTRAVQSPIQTYPTTANANTSVSNAGVIAVPGPSAVIASSAVLGAPSATMQSQSSSQAPIQASSGYNQAAAAQQTIAPQVATAAPVLAENDYYQQGFNLLKQEKHKDAITVFEQQIQAYPQGEYADDAYYWIAESMYVNRNLDQAKKNFKSIIDNYKQSPRLPDAMLKTAYIEQDQGNQIEAQLLLQEILQFHPRSNSAIAAKNRLAEMLN